MSVRTGLSIANLQDPKRRRTQELFRFRLLAAVTDHPARLSPGWYDPVRLIDATAALCAASLGTIRRSDLAGRAHYGCCAAPSLWYWD